MSRTKLFTLSLFLSILLLAQATTGPAAARDKLPDVQTAAQAVVAGIFSECSEDRPHNNSDAVYRICTPPWWWSGNGELVIWAHGYVDATRPVEIPEDQLCLGGTLCIPDMVNYLGYDFITTSYSVNGLAVVPGIPDVIELVDLYTAEHGPPDRVYLVGASEGGLITTLAVEQYPDVFDGGLAACGPIGDFARQTNYIGDFRAVLDVFFPNLMPGDPIDIPPELMDEWDTFYQDEVKPALLHRANRRRLRQLVNVTDLPFDPANYQQTLETSLQDLLWYNVFATNNAADVLGGQPFDNLDREYAGSRNDALLNARVQRFSADPAALDEIEAHYQTIGVLQAPLVTLHTTLDQLVPYWHEDMYLEKTIASGAWPEFHANYTPTETYGHCMFDVDDLLGAFDLLVEMVNGSGLDQELVRALLSELGPEARRVSLHRPGLLEPR